MKELQKQSAMWGVVALVLGIVSFVLILPTWPTRSKIEVTDSVLTATPGLNPWTEYFGHCVLRAGIVLLGTFGVAVLILFAEYFRHKFLSAW
jgi:hypothetical protein